MIKMIVSNMSCGHCELKIRAELESNGYEIKEINMNESSLLVNTSISELTNIKTILDNIHYVVDEQQPVLVIEERRLWDEKLISDKTYHVFQDYLQDNGIDMIGFDEDKIEFILLCTDEQYNHVLQFVKEL